VSGGVWGANVVKAPLAHLIACQAVQSEGEGLRGSIKAGDVLGPTCGKAPSARLACLVACVGGQWVCVERVVEVKRIEFEPKGPDVAGQVYWVLPLYSGWQRQHTCLVVSGPGFQQMLVVFEGHVFLQVCALGEGGGHPTGGERGRGGTT
jgi:hypothetical protein